jgi:hypothetical protein
MVTTHERRSRGQIAGRGRWIVVVGLLCGIVLLAIQKVARTPQEKLAAFEASCAVPDDHNAALIYAELLRGEQLPPDKVEGALEPLMAAALDPVSFHQYWTTSRRLRALELP